jgi:hypothetical protein
MQRLRSVLARDWEKALFASALLVALCLTLSWLRLAETPGTHDRPAGKRLGTSLLGPDACAFLAREQRVPETQSLDGLFAFAYKQPAAERQPPAVKAPAEPVHDIDTVCALPAQPTSKEPPPPLSPVRSAASPVERELRTVRYIGIYVGTSGRRLAAVEIRDPKSGRSRAGFWAAGPVADGIRLEAFDGNTLRFLAPGGDRVTVARGAQASIPLHSLHPRPGEHQPER